MAAPTAVSYYIARSILAAVNVISISQYAGARMSMATHESIFSEISIGRYAACHDEPCRQTYLARFIVCRRDFVAIRRGGADESCVAFTPYLKAMKVLAYMIEIRA